MDNFELCRIEVTVGSNNPIPQVAKRNSSNRNHPEEAVFWLGSRAKVEISDNPDDSGINAQEEELAVCRRALMRSAISTYSLY